MPFQPPFPPIMEEPPQKEKNMKARMYEPNRKLLETLIGYVEAARVKTLDQYDRTEE